MLTRGPRDAAVPVAERDAIGALPQDFHHRALGVDLILRQPWLKVEGKAQNGKGRKSPESRRRRRTNALLTPKIPISKKDAGFHSRPSTVRRPYWLRLFSRSCRRWRRRTYPEPEQVEREITDPAKRVAALYVLTKVINNHGLSQEAANKYMAAQEGSIRPSPPRLTRHL